MFLCDVLAFGKQCICRSCGCFSCNGIVYTYIMTLINIINSEYALVAMSRYGAIWYML